MVRPSRSVSRARGTGRAQQETLLLVSSRDRLTARYGEGGFHAIRNSLDDFRVGLSKRGVKLMVGLVDDRGSMSGLGVTPLKRITAASVKGVLDAMRERASGRSKPPLSVLILGGHEVIPYFKLANPAFDSDGEVLSDNPYGSRPGALSSEKCLLPDVPVGRMPDGEGRGLDLLTAQLALAARAGGPPESRRRALDNRDGRQLAYTAAVWQKASREVAKGLGWEGALKVSPPLTHLSVKKGWFEGKTHLYFNLHGSDREPYWFGQQANTYPTALSPRNVTNLCGGPNVVVTEACYGAIEAGRGSETSMALAFLSAGALCFLGSTCVAYGALVPPVSEADLIALHFFRNLHNGMTYGKALVNARAQLAALAVSRQGYLDEDDRKTLLEFVLFGDPTLRLPLAG